MLASPNSRLSATPRFILGMLLSLVICFGVQAYLYYALDWKTGKGESNYFSTMSRFQAAATPPADIALAGSSITGRLPGREVGNDRVANLGSDGGPALDGIRMLVKGKIAAPRWLVVETNTLYGGVGFGESLISRSANGPWFDVGARAPLLGASARPTAMFYAQLLRRPKVLTGESFALTAETISPLENKEFNLITHGEKARLDDYVSSIRELRKCGTKVLFVTYPAGAMTDRQKKLMRTSLIELSADSPVTYLDLSVQIPIQSIRFTDGVHMEPESAARVLNTIVEFCDSMEGANY